MGGSPGLWAGVPVAVFVVLVLANAVKIVREHERGVVFRLGRLQGAKGPGLLLIIPVVDRMVRVDLRTVTLDLPSQEVITRDNVIVRVNAVCHFRVVDPCEAVVQTEHYGLAAEHAAQMALRRVLDQHGPDDLLARRSRISAQVQQAINEETQVWGVKVTAFELKLQ